MNFDTTESQAQIAIGAKTSTVAAEPDKTAPVKRKRDDDDVDTEEVADKQPATRKDESQTVPKAEASEASESESADEGDADDLEAKAGSDDSDEEAPMYSIKHSKSKIVTFDDNDDVTAPAAKKPVEPKDELQIDPEAKEIYETSKKLKQYYSIIPCKQRLIALAAFLRWKLLDDDKGKAMVFMSSRDLATFHFRLLTLDLGQWYLPSDRHMPLLNGPICGDIPVFVLHGGLAQEERSATFHAFAAAKRAILVSTDVAARGLHLPKVRK